MVKDHMKILKYLELKHNENTKILSPLPLFYLFTYLEHSWNSSQWRKLQILKVKKGQRSFSDPN